MYTRSSCCPMESQRTSCKELRKSGPTSLETEAFGCGVDRVTESPSPSWPQSFQPNTYNRDGILPPLQKIRPLVPMGTCQEKMHRNKNYDHGRTRTCSLLIRSQALYPMAIEPHGHSNFSISKRFYSIALRDSLPAGGLDAKSRTILLR